MYPPPFDYRAPRSVPETLDVLAEYGDEASVVAGGMSLIPLMKLRFAEPAVLVDLNHVAGLDQLEETAEGLSIGPLVRHNTLARSPLIRQRYPSMAAAAPFIADPLVRNRGTLAGSLAHADPSGDWASVMLALRAGVVARNTGGERTIPIREFLTGPYTTVLEPTEVLTEVRVPAPSTSSAGAYHKLERKVGDFGTVGVAVQLDLQDGRIGRAGLGLTAVSSHNIVPTEAEQALAGAEPTDSVFDEAAELAARDADPHADVRGSAEYKRHVVRTFVRRGLRESLDQARTP